MPVNHSDIKFFEVLQALMQQTQSVGSNERPTIEQVRQAPKQCRVFVDTPRDVPFKDYELATDCCHKINLRYYAKDKQQKPLIIYFPGNAFIHELSYENHSIISKIVEKAGCHAVMVEPRLSPEHPYPKPLEDAQNAIQYLVNNHEYFHFDKQKIILAGYSSGANLAAVCTNQARFDDSVQVCHQLLISGAFDYTNALQAFDDYVQHDQLLDPEAAQFSFDCYSKPSQRQEPTCSPYWTNDLSGLPPTTIMMAEYDGGRSQSEGYAEKLNAAGNSVNKIVMPGQTHGTILYRRICSDGQDPAEVAGESLYNFLYK